MFHNTSTCDKEHFLKKLSKIGSVGEAGGLSPDLTNSFNIYDLIDNNNKTIKITKSKIR